MKRRFALGVVALVAAVGCGDSKASQAEIDKAVAAALATTTTTAATETTTTMAETTTTTAAAILTTAVPKPTTTTTRRPTTTTIRPTTTTVYVPPPPPPTTTTTQPPAPKRNWVVVSTSSGSQSTWQSSPFMLQGGQQKITSNCNGYRVGVDPNNVSCTFMVYKVGGSSYEQLASGDMGPGESTFYITEAVSYYVSMHQANATWSYALSELR